MSFNLVMDAMWPIKHPPLSHSGYDCAMCAWGYAHCRMCNLFSTYVWLWSLISRYPEFSFQRIDRMYQRWPFMSENHLHMWSYLPIQLVNVSINLGISSVGRDSSAEFKKLATNVHRMYFKWITISLVWNFLSYSVTIFLSYLLDC